MAMRPVPDNHRITQRFDGSFSTKFSGGARHGAIDYGSPLGTPVVAVEDGIIAFEGWSSDLPAGSWESRDYQIRAEPHQKGSVGGGILIRLNTADGGRWWYAHLNTTTVDIGQRVRKGQVIGTVGSTGSSTGPHLHIARYPAFPNWGNGSYGSIDPEPLLRESYRPLSDVAMVAPTPGGGTGGSTPLTASAPLPALPTVEKQDRSPNYTTGRAYKVSGVTIHWWGAPGSGATHDGVASWLSNPQAKVSAHYVVSKGRVTRVVHPDNTAWHAGHAVGNGATIGIECDPNDPHGTLPTVAALIRDLQSAYGPLKIHEHKEWYNTQCPGDYSALMPRLAAMVNTGLMGVSSVALTDADVQRIARAVLDAKLPKRGLEKVELTVQEALAWEGDNRNKVNALYKFFGKGLAGIKVKPRGGATGEITAEESLEWDRADRVQADVRHKEVEAALTEILNRLAKLEAK